MGNLRSIERAFHHLGAECRIDRDLLGADRLVVPGVGAFGAAMDRLEPMVSEIVNYARRGNPILGICLGQQLFFEVGEEHGERNGLGLVPGRVRYLPASCELKVPHIGWNQVRFLDPDLGSELAPQEQFYFVHSLYVDCSDDKDVAATSEYGMTFPAAVRRGNLWGTQFHPEKSGNAGLQILKNFLKC